MLARLLQRQEISSEDSDDILQTRMLYSGYAFEEGMPKNMIVSSLILRSYNITRLYEREI